MTANSGAFRTVSCFVSRMSVGDKLERARAAAGLSLAEIASRTQLSPQVLGAIEHQDFDALPARIPLRAIIHTYAKALGLDPDDVAEQYLRELDDRTGLAAFDSEDGAGVASAPAVDETPVPHAVGPLPDHQLVAASQSPPWRRAQFVTPTPLPETGSTFLTPPTIHETRPRAVSSAVVLIVAAAAMIVGYIVGSRSDSAVAPHVARSTNRPNSVAPSGGTDAVPARADESTSRLPASRAESANRDAAPIDLTGIWTLTNRVDSTSYPAFKNLRLGYEVQLQQRGQRVWGTGHKLSENGRTVPQSQRTPIVFEGVLDARTVTLQFSETGTRRQSAGQLTLNVAADGSLHGSFSSDAARSRGQSQARRRHS